MKARRAARLTVQQDFVVLTETHGNEGKCRGRRLPKGFKGFWSNGEGGEAGVGMWIREEFLKKIEGGSGNHEWVD
eukprot:7351404-Heterocapsa_arctica.AAC.1